MRITEIPPFRKTTMWVPTSMGMPLFYLGLYRTRKEALAEKMIDGRLMYDGGAIKVWIAVEKQP